MTSLSQFTGQGGATIVGGLITVPEEVTTNPILSGAEVYLRTGTLTPYNVEYDRAATMGLGHSITEPCVEVIEKFDYIFDPAESDQQRLIYTKHRDPGAAGHGSMWLYFPEPDLFQGAKLAAYITEFKGLPIGITYCALNDVFYAVTHASATTGRSTVYLYESTDGFTWELAAVDSYAPWGSSVAASIVFSKLAATSWGLVFLENNSTAGGCYAMCYNRAEKKLAMAGTGNYGGGNNDNIYNNIVSTGDMVVFLAPRAATPSTQAVNKVLSNGIVSGIVTWGDTNVVSSCKTTLRYISNRLFIFNLPQTSAVVPVQYCENFRTGNSWIATTGIPATTTTGWAHMLKGKGGYWFSNSSSTSARNLLYYSTDCITWTGKHSTSDTNGQGVLDQGEIPMLAGDGFLLTHQSLLLRDYVSAVNGTTNNYRDWLVRYNDTTLFATLCYNGGTGGYDQVVIRSIDNGVTWTVSYKWNSSTTTNYARQVKVCNGLVFILPSTASGSPNLIVSSNVGDNWTPVTIGAGEYLYDIEYFPAIALYVAGKSTSTNLYYSTLAQGALTWATAGAATNPSSFAVGPSRLALTANGYLYTTADLNTIVYANFSSVAVIHDGTRFVAFGSATTGNTGSVTHKVSTDGVTWTSVVSPTGSPIVSSVGSNGMYGFYDGKYYVWSATQFCWKSSTDLITWDVVPFNPHPANHTPRILKSSDRMTLYSGLSSATYFDILPSGSPPEFVGVDKEISENGSIAYVRIK